jgi:hypothetical protein
LFALLIGYQIEVKCGSKSCGAGPGVVVLHRFDSTTGEVLGTTRYRTL